MNVACQRTAGKDICGLIAEGNYKAVVSALLEEAGLNYGALPKGLLKFHKYEEGSRTPLEEHLAEGAMYAAGKCGKVNVHFTVSTEHRELFKVLVAEKAGRVCPALWGRLQYHFLRAEAQYRYDCRRYG